MKQDKKLTFESLKEFKNIEREASSKIEGGMRWRGRRQSDNVMDCRQSGCPSTYITPNGDRADDTGRIFDNVIPN